MASGIPLSAYVHLPWCVRKCPYCDFNSHTAGPPEQRDRYLDALFTDFEQDASHVAGRPLETVFLGGGTPSLFLPEQINALLTRLRRTFDVSPDAEVTMEANPGTLEHGRLAGYREAGVNRLSLGAQSFEAEQLRRLGRIHGPDDVVNAFHEARSAGFDNINIDLMHALPGQSVAAALVDLDAALELEPEHVSHYQLTLEPNTVFFVRPPDDLPDEDAVFDIQAASLERLEGAGFRRYEVSAFAREGRECRHNLNYWRYGDYLGLGAGAHGKLTTADGRVTRTEKPANPLQYAERMASGTATRTLRTVGDDERAFEFMLNTLRLSDGFTLAEFEAATGLPASNVLARLESLAARELMSCGTDRIWKPTERGFRFVNDLQSAFLPT